MRYDLVVKLLIVIRLSTDDSTSKRAKEKPKQINCLGLDFLCPLLVSSSGDPVVVHEDEPLSLRCHGRQADCHQDLQ